jgi:MFS transporter, ACS family, tartrate transporter
MEDVQGRTPNDQAAEAPTSAHPGSGPPAGSPVGAPPDGPGGTGTSKTAVQAADTTTTPRTNKGVDAIITGNEAETPEVDRKALIRKIGFRLLPIMMLGYFIDSLDKTNISVASLTMDKDLGLTATSFGLASGLFFVGYFFFEVPSNLIQHKVGARIWIARIMITWGIVSAATAFVSGPASLYTLRILLGIAEAGFYPGILFYLTYWVPTRDRAQIMAFFVLGGSASGLVGPPLSAWVLSLGNGPFGLAGWRMMFLVEGLPAILVGIAVLAILKDRPSQATWLDAREKAWLNRTMKEEAQEIDGGHTMSAFRSLRDPRILMLSFAYLCKCCGQYALNFFTPQMIVALELSAHTHYSTVQVGLLTAVPTVFAMAASIWWARHSDRTQERLWHSSLPLVLAALGVWVLAAVHQPVVYMIGLCLAAIGIGTQSTSFFQLPSTFLTGAAVAGGLAMVNAVGNLGGFFAPYMTGWLKDVTGNFTLASIILGILLALGAVCTMLFGRMAGMEIRSWKEIAS